MKLLMWDNNRDIAIIIIIIIIIKDFQINKWIKLLLKLETIYKRL